MLYIWFSANESVMYRFFPRLASYERYWMVGVIENDKVINKSKEQTSYFFLYENARNITKTRGVFRAQSNI